MLERILGHINNYFERDARTHKRRIYAGEYTISNGGMNLPEGIKEGQHFRICGSDMNDGVYLYYEGAIMNADGGEAVLTDETFDGEVWLLAIPPRLKQLAAEIDGWNKKYAKKMASPFQSESFKGYSYTLKSGSDGTGGIDAQAWQTAFAAQLDEWRKLS